MIFLPKKHKERTPEEYRRRFYVSIGIIAVMLMVCIVVPRTSNKEKKMSITEIMDLQADSLIKAFYGPEATIIERMQVETCEEPSEAGKRLESAKESLRLTEKMEAAGMDIPEERFIQLNAAIDSIKETYGDEVDKMTKYYVRRLIFKANDSTTVSCFQRTDEKYKVRELKNMIEIKDIDKSKSQIEKIINNIDL